jgi:hypothetical protein
VTPGAFEIAAKWRRWWRAPKRYHAFYWFAFLAGMIVGMALLDIAAHLAP